MNILPPLRLLEQWRAEGLSPQEIYERCLEIDKEIRQARLKGTRERPRRVSPQPVQPRPSKPKRERVTDRRGNPFDWESYLKAGEQEEIATCPGCNERRLCSRHYQRLYGRTRPPLGNHRKGKRQYAEKGEEYNNVPPT